MKTNKTAHRKYKDFLSILAVPVIFLLLYLILPYRLCFVPSGSMEPNIPTWSLCVINVRIPYEDIELGDVVVYSRHSDGTRIIHRVIEIRENALVTKGDANRSDDGPSVTPDNLYGKYLFHIPWIGKPLYYAKTPAGIAVTAGLILVLLFLSLRDGKQKPEEDDGEGQEQ